MKLKIGQILYMGYYTKGQPPNVTELTITSIGRKFFYCDGFSVRRYSISELKHESESSSNNIQLYLTSQEIIDRWEKDNRLSLIRKQFSSYGSVHYTLEQLTKVCEILNITP